MLGTLITLLIAGFLVLRGIQLKVPEKFAILADSIGERLSGLVRPPTPLRFVRGMRQQECEIALVGGRKPEPRARAISATRPGPGMAAASASAPA